MDNASARFLLVYDGSSIADRALDATITRALSSDASVTLLFVVPPRLWRAKRGQFQISPEKHDEEFARDLLAHAKHRCREAGVRVETRVRTGPPAHVIAEEASRDYEVIVFAERPNVTGAPTLASVVVVPSRTEVVVIR